MLLITCIISKKGGLVFGNVLGYWLHLPTEIENFPNFSKYSKRKMA
jgi:hypothetical protein